MGPELDLRESEPLDFQNICLLPLPIQALSLHVRMEARLPADKIERLRTAFDLYGCIQSFRLT